MLSCITGGWQAMITLLLVEDEAEAREGLKKFVPWNTIGIDRIEEATNGLAAIDLCESIRPDILLTDVRMPKVDGIQLAFYIRERFPMCKIIFVSGYSDKDYLKSAIRMGAISYIEKPISIQELSEALTQAACQYREEQKKQDTDAYLNAVTREGMPLILQKLAAGACYGIRKGADCLQLIQHLNIDNEHCSVCTLAVKLHEDAALTEYESEYFRADIIAFVNSDACQTDSMKPAACFLDSRSLIVHCFFTGSADSNSQLAVLSGFLSKLNSKYSGKYVFTAVTGTVAESLQDIPRSFQSAQKMVKALFYNKKGELYTFSDLKEYAFTLSNDDVNEFDRLLQDQPGEVHAWLARLEDSISRYPCTDIGYVKNVFFMFYEQMALAARKRNIKIGLLDEDKAYFWQELSRMETLHDITLYFHSLADSYSYATGTTITAGVAIQDIIEYIKKNYNDQNLSIKKIAEYSHYDYYYLCSLFKKNVKTTLNDFIAKIRVEKAIGFLKDRHIRLHDITGMVGYSDPSYFTKLFKKHVGSTPSEFRKKYCL